MHLRALQYFHYLVKNLHIYCVFTDCTPTIDPLVIILPVTGTILLIGIISMISWKFVVDYRDRKAYNEYLIEKEMAKWSNVSLSHKPELSLISLAKDL